MSHIQKRKQLALFHLQTDICSMTENQEIAQILGSPGNNLHQVETSKGEIFLASLPTVFRKTVWVRLGSFVVIEPLKEGVKVKAEIVHVLTKQQVRELVKAGLWPSHFDSAEKNQISEKNIDNDEDDIFINVNKKNSLYAGVDSDESDSSSEDSDESDASSEDEDSGEGSESDEEAESDDNDKTNSESLSDKDSQTGDESQSNKNIALDSKKLHKDN